MSRTSFKQLLMKERLMDEERREQQQQQLANFQKGQPQNHQFHRNQQNRHHHHHQQHHQNHQNNSQNNSQNQHNNQQNNHQTQRKAVPLESGNSAGNLGGNLGGNVGAKQQVGGALLGVQVCASQWSGQCNEMRPAEMGQKSRSAANGPLSGAVPQHTRLGRQVCGPRAPSLNSSTSPPTSSTSMDSSSPQSPARHRHPLAATLPLGTTCRGPSQPLVHQHHQQTHTAARPAGALGHQSAELSELGELAGQPADPQQLGPFEEYALPAGSFPEPARQPDSFRADRRFSDGGPASEPASLAQHFLHQAAGRHQLHQDEHLHEHSHEHLHEHHQNLHHQNQQQQPMETAEGEVGSSSFGGLVRASSLTHSTGKLPGGQPASQQHSLGHPLEPQLFPSRLSSHFNPIPLASFAAHHRASASNLFAANASSQPAAGSAGAHQLHEPQGRPGFASQSSSRSLPSRNQRAALLTQSTGSSSATFTLPNSTPSPMSPEGTSSLSDLSNINEEEAWLDEAPELRASSLVGASSQQDLKQQQQLRYVARQQQQDGQQTQQQMAHSFHEGLLSSYDCRQQVGGHKWDSKWDSSQQARHQQQQEGQSHYGQQETLSSSLVTTTTSTSMVQDKSAHFQGSRAQPNTFNHQQLSSDQQREPKIIEQNNGRQTANSHQSASSKSALEVDPLSGRPMGQQQQSSQQSSQQANYPNGYGAELGASGAGSGAFVAASEEVNTYSPMLTNSNSYSGEPSELHYLSSHNEIGGNHFSSNNFTAGPISSSLHSHTHRYDHSPSSSITPTKLLPNDSSPSCHNFITGDAHSEACLQQQQQTVAGQLSSSYPNQSTMDYNLRALTSKERIKKDNHNQIERRRRYNINDRIKELSSLLPTQHEDSKYQALTKDLKQHKGNILKASVDYLRLLKKDYSNLERNYQELADEHKRALMKLQELELVGNNGNNCNQSQRSSAGAEAPMLWHPSAPNQMVSNCNSVDHNNNDDLGAERDAESPSDHVVDTSSADKNFYSPTDLDGQQRNPPSPIERSDNCSMMNVDDELDNQCEIEHQADYDTLTLQDCHSLSIKKERDSEINSSNITSI